MKNNLIDIFRPTTIDSIIVEDSNGSLRFLDFFRFTDDITEDDCKATRPVKATIKSINSRTTITITVKFSENPTISFLRSDVNGDEIEETHWVAKHSINYDDNDVISVTKNDCGVIISTSNQSIHDPNDGYEVTDLLNFVKKTVLDPIDQWFDGKLGKKVFDHITWK